MMRSEVLEKLNEVFKEVFDDESIVVKEDTTSDEIEAWDSLMHITLVSEIDYKFNININMEDMNKLNNVGEMVSIIMELIS